MGVSVARAERGGFILNTIRAVAGPSGPVQTPGERAGADGRYILSGTTSPAREAAGFDAGKHRDRLWAAGGTLRQPGDRIRSADRRTAEEGIGMLPDRFNHDGGTVGQHLGDAVHDLRGVVARADDGISAHLSGVLQHQVEGVLAGALAHFRE